MIYSQCSIQHAFLVVLLLCCKFSLAISMNGRIHAPSVFRSDEVDMHKYSAILAATEPIKQQSQETIKRSLTLFQYSLSKFSGQSLLQRFHRLRAKNKGVDAACSRYESKVRDTMRSYGLDPRDFNAITERLIKQPGLKQKVLLQSYYYKIAADLEGNLKPPLPLTPSIASGFRFLKFQDAPSSSTVRRDGSVEVDSEAMVALPQLSRFSRSLQAIERERLQQRANIMAQLNIKELPPVISDPELQGALNPVIQQAVEAFPRRVEQIVSAHGLFVEEFNALYGQMDRNPIFRYRVDREIKRIQRDAEKAAAAAATAENSSRQSSGDRKYKPARF